MNPKIYPLPFDITGEHEGNLVVNEYHDLTLQGNYENKIIVMDKGHFYKDTVRIETPEGKVLTRGVDYQLTGFSSEAYKLTGLEPCSIIVIKLTALKHIYKVTAQMVGGRFCDVGNAIVGKILGLSNNTRKLKYVNIKDIPDTLELNMHMHPYWDLYNFKPRTAKIERITDIYIRTLGKEFNELKTYVKDRFDERKVEKERLDDVYRAHIADRNTPHRLTAKQVQLENVVNGPVGTLTDMRGFTDSPSNKYLTPRLNKEFIDFNFIPQLEAHTSDKDNPHNVTAKQANTLTETEVIMKNDLYYDRGVTTNETIRFGGIKNASFVTTTQGKTFAVLYSELRANLHAPEINSGFLRANNLANTSLSSSSVLIYHRRSGAGNNSGNYIWEPINGLSKFFNGKSPTIYYAHVSRTTSMLNQAEMIARANATVNPATLEDGTLMVLSLYNTNNYYWYNGGRTNTIWGNSILVVRNKQWVI